MRLTDEVVEAVKELEDRQGRLLPSEVLNAARNEDSPLHGFFEWDESLAAEAYRLEQARELIRRIKIEVVFDEVKLKVVKYMHDVDLSETQQGYIQTLKIRKKNTGATLISELNSVMGLLVRAERFAETREADLPAGIVIQIKEVINLLNEIINNL